MNFWHTCVKWQYLQVFFSFFQILIFWVVRVVKGHKIAQKDKNLCLLRLISHEPYIIWPSFVVHKCRLIISTGGVFLLFYFFKIFIFSVVRRVKEQKMTRNDKKLCLLHFISLEPYIIWSWFIVHMYKRIISPGVFYIFSKF